MRSWKLTTAFFLSASSLLAPGQGTFQNLDFESAVLVSAGAPFVQFASAFPGWTCTIGTNVIGAALYDRAALDSSAISIIRFKLGRVPGFSFGRVIEGKFTAVLQAGVSGPASQMSRIRLFRRQG